jgi:hypothetical protein
VQSTQSQFFSASYDLPTKIVSTVVCVILVVVAAAAQSAVAVGIGALLIIVSYAYSPRGYAIQERSIIIKRPVGNVRFPLERVQEARRRNADDLRGCIRLWGNGGVFGYYGLFRTSKLGKCTWYVTNRSNAVVVITGEKTALFSPDDGDGFLAAIRAAVPIQEMHVVGAAVAVVALGIFAFALLYSPGPPSYTLTPSSLIIHDRFYPVTVNAVAVDVNHIRVVDISVETDWRPTERTNGFANAHYRSGWFRIANGQKVRMYRADGNRLVLLPPKRDGAPVFLETKDPERFVDEVRQKWSGRS